MKFLSVALGTLTFLLFCASVVLYMIYPVPMVVNIFWSLTAAAAIGWAFVSRAALLFFFTRKSTRYGANLAFVVFLVLGILVVINVLGKEYSWRKDLTKASLNSLSPQTLKVLHGLHQDVKAYYFGTMPDKTRNEPLLKEYTYQSPHLKYEFVDTTRRPTLTQSMGVKRNETVVFVLGDTNKKSTVQGVSEEKLTNGLIKLLRAKDQVVYFTTGHGERSLEGGTPLSFKEAKGELEKQGYTVKELNLFNAGKIPADAAVLVVAGPTSTFFPKELGILSDWIKAGGRALFAVDLSPADDGLTKGSQQLVGLLKPYGVDLHSQMLVDPTSQAANIEPQVLLGFSATKEHPITKDFPYSAIAANFFFPLTTYMDLAPNQNYRDTQLVRTTQNAWAESDWKSLKAGKVTYNPGQDKRGQMTLAAAVESEHPKQEGPDRLRLVVFGTSTFATDNVIDKVGNRDLFLNSVAWLSSDEQFISIRAKTDESGLKEFNGGVLNLVLIISVFLMPALIAAAGVAVWFRRSKL